MPYTPEQWRAIAADVMRRKGRKKGRAYLHRLKAEAAREAARTSGRR